MHATRASNIVCSQGGLVALWMTNRARLWRFVESELLPAWGVCNAATWAWLKISSQGQLLGRLVRLSCLFVRPADLVFCSVYKLSA